MPTNSLTQRFTQPGSTMSNALSNPYGTTPATNRPTNPNIGPTASVDGSRPRTPGTGAPAGVSGPGGFDVGSTTAQTAFGKTFNPGYDEEVWADPTSLINAWFDHKGMPTHSGGYAVAKQQADNLGILWMLLQGDNATSMANYEDWAGQYLEQQFTPGGTRVSPREVMNAILNPGDPETTILGSHLNNDDLTAADQVQNVLSAMRYGMQGSVPRPVLDAYLNQARSLGEDFTAHRATNKDGGFTYQDYLKQQGFRPGNFGN